jgi:hypothetical protein
VSLGFLCSFWPTYCVIIFLLHVLHQPVEPLVKKTANRADMLTGIGAFTVSCLLFNSLHPTIILALYLFSSPLISQPPYEQPDPLFQTSVHSCTRAHVHRGCLSSNLLILKDKKIAFHMMKRRFDLGLGRVDFSCG